MKLWKSVFALVAPFVFSASLYIQPLHAQPLQKPVEAEMPHINLAQLSDLLGGPTKVALRYENAELNTVLKDVSDKFGVPVVLYPRTGPKGPVTFDAPDATLWSACDFLRSQIQYDRNGPKTSATRALMLMVPSVTVPYITQDTALFQLRTPGMRATDNGWTMTIYLLADPKLDIAPSSGRIRLTEAIDEQGRNLLANSADEVRSSSLYSTAPSLYYGSLSHKGDKPISKKLTRLRGVISAYAIVKRESWEIPLAELPQQKTITNEGAANLLSVSEVQHDDNKDSKNKDRFNVELTRSYKSLFNYRFWPSSEARKNYVYNYALFAGIQLLDAQGRKFYLRKTSGDTNYEDENYFYSWKGRFERTPETPREDDVTPEGDPVKLVWSLPGEIRRFEVPFELTDVPIN